MLERESRQLYPQNVCALKTFCFLNQLHLRHNVLSTVTRAHVTATGATNEAHIEFVQ